MGKGANQNMGYGGVRQNQMNLVPPYQPPSMGGKGGMQQQPPNMSNFQQPNFDAVNALNNMFGGMQSQFTGTGQPAQQPTQQPTPKQAVPDYLMPYVNKLADRMPRPNLAEPRPGGFFRPTPRPDPFQNFMQQRNDFVNSDNDLNTIRYQQMVLEDKMRRQQAAQQPAAPTDMPAEGADPAMAQPQPPAFDEGMMNQMDMLNQQYMNRLNQSPFGRPMGRFGPFGRFPGMGGKGVRRPLFGRFGPSMGGFEGARLQGGTGTDMQRGTTSSNRLGQLFGLASGMNPFSR